MGRLIDRHLLASVKVSQWENELANGKQTRNGNNKLSAITKTLRSLTHYGNCWQKRRSWSMGCLRGLDWPQSQDLSTHISRNWGHSRRKFSSQTCSVCSSFPSSVFPVTVTASAIQSPGRYMYTPSEITVVRRLQKRVSCFIWYNF